MKTVLLALSVFLLFTVTRVQAQWRNQIGVNAVLLPVGRTLELTSEFSTHPAYSLTFNAGYTYRSPFQGYLKVHDGLEDRRSSGGFFKLGGRLYLLSLTGKDPAVNVFVGAKAIASLYYQTAIEDYYIYYTLTASQFPSAIEPYKGRPEAKGFIWGTALTGGVTIRLSDRLALDGGVQYGFQPIRTDYLGSRNFNYQPGFGLSRPGGGSLVTSLQAITTIKYRFGSFEVR